MSSPNNEGQPTPGEEKQEETRESDNMEVAAKGSEDTVRLVNDVFYSGESYAKFFYSQNSIEKDSDDAEKSSDDMEKSVSEDSKATGDVEKTPKGAKTLQDFQLDHYNMGPNSPTGKRARSRTSDVWSSILRLKGELAKSELCADKTHICKHCCKLLKLYKSKSSWQTSIGISHLANCPEYAKLGIKSAAVETSNAAKATKKQKIQSVLMQAGSQSSDMKSPPPVIGGFVISRIDVALASQARFYIYGQQRVSKRTFADPAFIEMLVSCYVAGGGEAKNAPRLSVKALKHWLIEEFEIFKGYIKMTIQDMLAFTEGNPFAQCLNDACTLAHKHKCMAIGIEFVDCIHFQNHAVCLGLVPLSDGTDKVGAITIETVMNEVTGFKYNQVMAAMISDLAAKGIAREFEQEGESCDMHQGDKIGRSAIGDLVRSKNKVPVNPFPAGQILMKKCHSMAVYFSYGKRHKELLKFRSNVPGGLAQIKLKVDLNDTRVSARHGLLYSEIRLNKGLKLYAIANEQPWQLTAAQWQALTEVEAVLVISKELTVFVQNETAFTAAIGWPFKEKMLAKLRSDTLFVVDLEQVTESPNLIRHDVSLEDMTEVGRTCKWRATLEAERRYCGNASNDLNDEPVVRTDRDKLAVMLDPRTLISLSKCGVTKDERPLLLSALKEEYVKYGSKALLYQKERKAASIADAEQIVVESEKKKMIVAAQVDTLGLDSDSDDEKCSPGDGPSSCDESQNEIKLGEEFDAVYKRYKNACKALSWKELFPNLPWAKTGFEFPFSLWDVDMGCVMKKLIKQDPDKKHFGHLPMMAIASRGSIGGFLASSFCERINSCANLILTDGNSLLSSDEINMLVTLRMNRKFMQFMRENHAKDGLHKRLLSEIR
jgi:hypothetical protein